MEVKTKADAVALIHLVIVEMEKIQAMLKISLGDFDEVDLAKDDL